jgi:hypothetical protein
MSSLLAAPEMLASAATDLATIGSTLSAAHMAAVAPTLPLMPAAADEVSASIAHVFSVHAQDYQGLAGQAAAFHEQFVQHLTASAGSYASTEAANAASLQPLNAIAGSFTGAIAAIQDQVVNLFNTVLSQLLNLLTSFWNTLTSFVNMVIDLAVLLLVFGAIPLYYRLMGITDPYGF